ncbi:hypothetical protein P7K49_028325, partial [Saguinus oedipus]
RELPPPEVSRPGPALPSLLPPDAPGRGGGGGRGPAGLASARRPRPPPRAAAAATHESATKKQVRTRWGPAGGGDHPGRDSARPRRPEPPLPPRFPAPAGQSRKVGKKLLPSPGSPGGLVSFPALPARPLTPSLPRP